MSQNSGKVQVPICISHLGGACMYTLNSFFAGAGGFDLGFLNAGYKIVGAYEWDKYAVESYQANIDPGVKVTDVTEMTGADLQKADVWTFGFPCQDLSNNGVKTGLIDGYRSKTFFEVMRLLGEVEEKPRILLAENVRGLKKYLHILEDEYNKAGYKMYYTLYNSKYWNVPQSRDRYFVVGVRNDIEETFHFPEEQHEHVPVLYDFLEEDVPEQFFMKRPLNFIELGMEGQAIMIREAVKKGYSLANIGDTINITYPNSNTRRGRIGKQISQTLSTGLEHVIVLKDGRTRRFTPREYARLQGFPESYKQVVSNTQFYKQLGNAVTVPVAEAIANQIKRFLANL